MDDTFCFLSKSSVEEVQKHLNSVSPAIQFTVERETDNQLPFLDVLVMRDEGEKLKTTVYRKKTHTDRYLPFHSYHGVQAKANSVRTLMKRAHDLTSDQHLLKDELHHVQGVLKCNGYPKGFVRKYRVQHREEKDKKSEDDDEENKPLSTAKIPYIKGLGEEIRRILGQYNIRTVFRTTETLGRILTKVKDPTPPEERPGIVYKIKCICGDFYIGETGRSLTARMKEHKAACRLAAFERSAVAEHAWQAGHEIEWDDVEILDTATDLQERKVKEAVYIRLAPKGLKMNRDEGKELSPLWIRTISQARKKPPHEPHPPREPRPRDNRPPLRVRRRAPTTSPAPRQPTPPEGPPPAVRRPTPSLRRSRRLASTTPQGASDRPTVGLTI